MESWRAEWIMIGERLMDWRKQNMLIIKRKNTRFWSRIRQFDAGEKENKWRWELRSNETEKTGRHVDT